jgi:hypothetical protein
MTLKNKTNKWFYTKTHPLIHFTTHSFIKGDQIILIPLNILIFLTLFISFKFFLISYSAFIAIRYFGEMIYWIFQQFGDQKYRPHDFGLKNLDNKAIYILYQLISLAWIIFATIMLIIILYLNI